MKWLQPRQETRKGSWVGYYESIEALATKLYFVENFWQEETMSNNVRITFEEAESKYPII